MKKEGFPERGELVVIKIKRIMDYGSIAELIEYEGKEGFIHISNVTKSWVKNIRSHISKGETRVAEVVKVEPDKNNINLSLKDVSDSQKKRKMDEWKREKRTDKVVTKIAKDLDQDPQKSKEEIIPEMEKEFGEAFAAFEEIAAYGEEVLEDVGIPKEWKEKIIEFSDENIKPPEVSIEGQFRVKSYEPDGAEIVKKAISPHSGEKVDIEYISAPKYKVKITGMDYPEVEEKLDEIKEEVKKSLGEKGEFSFERD